MHPLIHGTQRSDGSPHTLENVTNVTTNGPRTVTGLGVLIRPMTNELTPSEEWPHREVQLGSRVRVRDDAGEREYTIVRSGGRSAAETKSCAVEPISAGNVACSPPSGPPERASPSHARGAGSSLQAANFPTPTQRDLRSRGEPSLTHTGPLPPDLALAVCLGATVRVRDADGEEEYTIVSSAEADARQGRISSESPVGRALLHAREGDQISVQTPGGIRALAILGVTTPPP
jgi:transcription elongation GreA/GreB family factor